MWLSGSVARLFSVPNRAVGRRPRLLWGDGMQGFSFGNPSKVLASKRFPALCIRFRFALDSEASLAQAGNLENRGIP